MVNSIPGIQQLKQHLPAPIWDLYRTLKSPKNQLAIWADYLRTMAEAKFIREDHELAPTNGKVALVASMTDFVFQLKLEALLAAALKKNGWKVIVLTTDASNVWAKRYFSAFGIHDFVYWNKSLITTSDTLKCEAEAKILLNEPGLDFQKVKSWKFENSWIGPQILSSIARATHKGAPNLSDPEVKTRMASLLPETLLRVLQAKKLLGKIKPSFIYGIEANYSIMGPIVDQAIALGTPFAQVVQPSRDDALVIRRLTNETRRTHPNTITKENFERICATLPWGNEEEKELEQEFSDRYGGKWFLQSRNQVGTKFKTRTEIIQQLALDPNKKNAVVFSHILWDANLFYGEDLFLDYEDWFVQTLKAACANPSINWLIKLHPANIWKRARDQVEGELAEEELVRRHVGTLPAHVKLLFPDTDISTSSLFDLADYGITVRGTAGMELPCYGKLTFTAGTGRYSHLGFTNDSNSKEEYLNKLATIQNFSPMPEAQILRAKKFAYGVFRLRPFVLKSCVCFFNYRKKGHHPLDHNLKLTVSTWNEVKNNGDLQAFANWAANPSAIDYLNEQILALKQ